MDKHLSMIWNTSSRSASVRFLLAILAMLAPVSQSFAQGTAFTYQGELADGASLADGNYDLRFRLFDQLLNGSLVGSPSTLTFTNSAVAAGQFTTSLDFGTNAFTGSDRFLEIAVRPGGTVVAFTVLAPRQKITPAPYAIHAISAAAPQRRTFYLTTSIVAGNAPINACVAGYHMASMWELINVGVLQYRTDIGFTNADSGDGPPASIAGWVRTGVPSFSNTVPGNANCDSWTSNLAGDNGTRVNLQPQWATAGEFVTPWDATIQACNASSRTWCIED